MTSPARSPLLSGRLHLKLVVIVVVILIVASASFIIIYPTLTRTSTSSAVQPHFAFLTSSVLNSTYGLGFESGNSSNNPLGNASNEGIAKEEIMMYETTTPSTYPIGIVFTLIVEMNSTSYVTAEISNLTYEMSYEGNKLASGTFDGFVFALYQINQPFSGSTAPTQVFVSYSGKFMLFMYFTGSTVSMDKQVFEDQLNLMISPPS